MKRTFPLFVVLIQETPPEYNVSRITAPVGLFWSENDWFADPKDVRQLSEKLPALTLNYKVPHCYRPDPLSKLKSACRKVLQ